MAHEYLLACLAFLAVNVVRVLSSTQDMEFTFVLPAGSKECFYQKLEKNSTLEFEYQVVGQANQQANQDITFAIISPTGRREFEDKRKKHALHKLAGTMEGEYQMCFDNSFSKTKEKLLFFTLFINDSLNDDEELAKSIITNEDAENTLIGFKSRLEEMHRQIHRGRVIQLMLRTYDTRDQLRQDNNLWRVDLWSAINICVIIAVAVTQVHILQSLFPGS
ncbi:transmembrane emp24 domain-containing protein 1-like [Stigmatopora argus]